MKLLRIPAGPLLIAVAATTATLATLAPEAGGPGVTCDELYHVGLVGKPLVTAFRQQGLAFFAPGNIERNFPWKADGPPVHPPLGNWILGWTHHLFDPAPDDPSVVSITAARFAPALAFGLLVLLVGLWTTRVEGRLAGTVAAAAVALVPRVFGHAHLAALDTFTVLFFVAAVLAVMEAGCRGGRTWHFAAAGVVWGLALLVRLHGVLVLPPVVAWLVWRLRRRALVPLVAWGTTGVATLYLGWPWLWLAPMGHLRQFLSTATGRQALHVFYAGRVWADRDVPWHYPAVMFVAVLPLGLLVLGLLGLWAKRPHPSPLPAEKGARRRPWKTEPEIALLAGTFLFVLLVFSWPGTPVYDGVRLFLMLFPLWAVWVGIGAKWIVEHPALPWLPRRLRLLGLGLFLLLQGTGLVLYRPCQLSHYGLLVGGLAGAERLGFEVSYWGDTVREPLLVEAARRSPGRPLLFGPHLAPFQAPGVNISSPALLEGRVTLVGWDPSRPELAAECRYAVVYHRRADLAAVEWVLNEGQVIAEYENRGVWLARLVELPGPLPTTSPSPLPEDRGGPIGNGR